MQISDGISQGLGYAGRNAVVLFTRLKRASVVRPMLGKATALSMVQQPKLSR